MSGIIGNNVARASGVIAAAGGGSNTPAFLVTKSGTQGITRHSVDKITWDTETYDTDGAFASDKFTVPADEGGKYFFYATARTQDNGGETWIYMYKNGAEIYRIYGKKAGTNCQISYQADLSATDYIEIYMMNNEPSPSIQTNAFFSGFKLID